MKKVILFFAIFSTVLLCSCKKDDTIKPIRVETAPFDLDKAEQLVTAIEQPIYDTFQKNSVTRGEYNSLVQYYEELSSELCDVGFIDMLFFSEEAKSESASISVYKNRKYSSIFDENIKILEAYTFTPIYEEPLQWLNKTELCIVEVEDDSEDPEEYVRKYYFVQEDEKWLLAGMLGGFFSVYDDLPEFY